jgi:plasmid maintenance system killer protein
MEINLLCGDVATLCNSQDEMRRTLGRRRADRLRQRLSELRGAETLEQFGRLPGPGCHELNGQRKGQLAARLDGSWLLIFAPADKPAPTKRGGRLDWSEVKRVVILEVTKSL